jgi:hypothetical protein
MTYGWEFAPMTGAFVGGFSLGFSVTIDQTKCPIAGACTAVSAEEQIFPGTAPVSMQAMSVVETSNGSPATQTVSLSNLALGDTTGLASFSGATAVMKMATASGISSTQPLLSFQSRLTETLVTVPEPMTFSLVGICVLGLGIMVRRHTHKVN